MTVFIRFTFSPRRLVEGNASFDPVRSSARFAEAVRTELTRALPGARIEVRSDGPPGVELGGDLDPLRTATLRSQVEEIAKAVRDCHPWPVRR